MSITPSHIIQFLYCPRFIFFEYVLCIPQYEEKNFKVMKGREIHDEKLEQNKNYLRKKIGVKEKYLDQYLTNDFLRGKVDEVLQLTDGTMAPLDYKYAEYKDRIFQTYKTQLICYAVLIEENFESKVNKGFLVYTRSKHKSIDVPITEKDKTEIKECSEQVVEIIEKNKYPKATKYKGRCLCCTYKNICTQ